jgi:hypothetical protein
MAFINVHLSGGHMVVFGVRYVEVGRSELMEIVICKYFNGLFIPEIRGDGLQGVYATTVWHVRGGEGGATRS